MAQKTDLPYYQIPDYPDSYSANNVAARMIDGLGFRYYWASEGLRSEDLAYRPTAEARSSEETIDHIYGLASIVVNSVKKVPNTGGNSTEGMDFKEKRKQTLLMLKEASDILKSSPSEEMEEYQVIFKSSSGVVEYPFWNQINGPISDALWHVGQLVTFRRSSGNPFNSKVSVLQGKVRE